MNQRANFFKIGLFVIIALTALIGGLIIFGLRETFRPGVTMETAFNQSVQGLNIGSDIKYRGVKIGTVQDIRLVGGVYRDVPDEYRSWVLVRSKIDSEFLRANDITSTQAGMDSQIERGLRVYLTPQGITGLAFLELDYESDKARSVADARPSSILRDPQWKKPENHIYIPAGAGFIKSVMDDARSIASNLEMFLTERVPEFHEGLLSTVNEATGIMDEIRLYIANDEFKGLPAKIDQLVANLTSLTDEERFSALDTIIANLETASAELVERASSEEFQNTLSDVRDLVAQSRSLSESLDREIPKTLQSIQSTVERFDMLLASQQQGLTGTTSDLRRTLRNIDELINALKHNPSLLLFSTDPIPVEPEK